MQISHLVARQVLWNEKGRRFIRNLIGVTVLFVVFIINFSEYIFTEDIDVLEEYFTPQQIKIVKILRIKYGYDQWMEDERMIEEGTTREGEGIDIFDSLSNLPPEGIKNNVPYYSQLDKRWKNIFYGPGDTIGDCGCGPTSLAMVISHFRGGHYDPVAISSWAYKHGYWVSKQGSRHSLIPEGAKAFNLNVDKLRSSKTKLYSALADGKVVIALMGPGTFTSSGHFIVITGINENGELMINDPASRSRTGKTWDIDKIVRESKKGANAGGPFWAIYP